MPTSRTFKPSSRSTASRSTKLTSAVTRICPTSQASYSDYECLCNNHNETAVYPLPSTSGGKIGYMHEFACKPTYQMVKTSPGWQAIQYQKQVSKSQINKCIVRFVWGMFICNLNLGFGDRISVFIESVSCRYSPFTIFNIVFDMFCNS